MTGGKKSYLDLELVHKYLITYKLIKHIKSKTIPVFVTKYNKYSNNAYEK